MNMFTKHPGEVGMNYFQHMFFAFSVVGKLIYAGFACTIHAFFPFFFTNTTSGIVTELHGKITHRKSHNE
jgi:hypothetical protein